MSLTFEPLTLARKLLSLFRRRIYLSEEILRQFGVSLDMAMPREFLENVFQGTHRGLVSWSISTCDIYSRVEILPRRPSRADSLVAIEYEAEKCQRDAPPENQKIKARLFSLSSSALSLRLAPTDSLLPPGVSLVHRLGEAGAQ